MYLIQDLIFTRIIMNLKNMFIRSIHYFNNNEIFNMFRVSMYINVVHIISQNFKNREGIKIVFFLM